MSDGETLKELKKISRILLLSNATVLEAELSRVASTDERKRMWALIDGTRLAPEIATRVHVSTMTVSRFLKEVEAIGLIEYQRQQPPRKVLDFVPAGWLSLLSETGEDEQ